MQKLSKKIRYFIAYNIHQIISIVFVMSMIFLVISRIFDFESCFLDYLFFFLLGANVFSYVYRWSLKVLNHT